jgi:hypothetical protein
MPFAGELEKLHPDDRHIRDKICQQELGCGFCENKNVRLFPRGIEGRLEAVFNGAFVDFFLHPGRQVGGVKFDPDFVQTMTAFIEVVFPTAVIGNKVTFNRA